jgi:HK97 family phage prohead protease
MSSAATTERRAAPLEVRAKGRRLEGYAAVFNTEARIGGRFSEIIKPGAFRSSLSAGGDMLALVDHDPARVLARTKSGTLRLSEDSKGLAFDLDVPDTQAGRDVLALAERGDLGGASFGFTVPDGGDHWNGDRRELRQIELFEVSIVSAWPAYDATFVDVRTRAQARPVRLALARRYLDTLGAR